jgi:xylulokinase
VQYLVGIDVGTSACKVAIFNERFELLSLASEKYNVNMPRPGWAEFNPNQIWDGVCKAVRTALEGLRVELVQQLFSVSFSVFGEGLITLDGKGEILYPGILCSDLRSTEIVSRMANDIDRYELFSTTGRTLHPMAVVTKIIWLGENRPDVVTSHTRFVDMHCWLHTKLGTGTITDHSTASGTMLFDIWRKAWSQDLLAYARIKSENLPKSVQAGTGVGHPVSEAASELGFPDARNVQIVVGAMDQMCNAVGSGTVFPGELICSMGTVEAVTVALATSDLECGALVGLNMPIVPSAIADQYVTHVFLWDGGRSLNWFCEKFAWKEREAAEASGTDVYSYILNQEPCARGVFFLPHLSGSGMPWQDPLSRGCFLGLTPAADVPSLAQAIIEGVTFELKINLDNLNSLGMYTTGLRVVGGGSRSGKWLQLKADVLERQVSRLAISEAGCMGAALLAGYGANLFGDLAKASKEAAITAESFQPSQRSEEYQRRYEVYKRIYPTIASLNQMICDLAV